jgi:uncharacterized protein YecT (DUF1311 family)
VPGRAGPRGRLLLAALAAACGWPAAGASASAPTLPTRAAPGSLSSLACPVDPVSTLALEACEGRALLGLDRTFNHQAAVVWSLLDPGGRRDFLAAEAAWLAYRARECDVGARAYLGGTAAGIEYGDCENELTAARNRELASLVALYCQGSAAVGRDRLCPRTSPRRRAGKS